MLSVVAPFLEKHTVLCSTREGSGRKYLMGKYHCAIDLLFDWFGLVFLQIKTKIVSCRIAYSKPVKQEVNGTVTLPPLVFPGSDLHRNKLD
jgi:hypothetical protein